MISLSYHELKLFSFPAGERGCVITQRDCFDPEDILVLTLQFSGSDDIIDMLNVVNAVRNMYGKNTDIVLDAAYLPFSRQDRVTEYGSAFSLQMFVGIVKMCGFSKIRTMDVHSEVAAALFDAGSFHNEPQDAIWYGSVHWLARGHKTMLISPDAGAAKKIHALAKRVKVGVVEANKVRDPQTGAITRTDINIGALDGIERAIIVDDICDGGRTFIELGKVIRAEGYDGELVLCVTHGVFSKGLTEDFNVFDRIMVKNIMNPTVSEAINEFNSRNRFSS